jgi:excisionase family DNA binding protein
MTNKLLYSPDELAELLGIAPSTLTRWRRTGDPELPYVRLGGRVRYRAADIERFLDELGRDGGDLDSDDEGADEEEEGDGS